MGWEVGSAFWELSVGPGLAHDPYVSDFTPYTVVREEQVGKNGFRRTRHLFSGMLIWLSFLGSPSSLNFMSTAAILATR